MQHTPGLESSPPVGYKVEVERSGNVLSHVVRCGRIPLVKQRGAAHGSVVSTEDLAEHAPVAARVLRRRDADGLLLEAQR
jgi:hypothetical protein